MDYEYAGLQISKEEKKDTRNILAAYAEKLAPKKSEEEKE